MTAAALKTKDCLSCLKMKTLLGAALWVSQIIAANSFGVEGRNRCHSVTRLSAGKGIQLAEQVTVKTEDATAAKRDGEIEELDTMEIKRRMLDLLPKMIGTAEDFRTVEIYVNALEERYAPVQTLEFLNFALAGEWQLLFSTNLSIGPKKGFRLRELFQRVETHVLDGNIENQAIWDLAEDGENFDASGKFVVKCSYVISQGSRMSMDLKDHVIELAKGSAVPKDVEGLVGLLHRAIPTELFDPSGHAADTTYLDGDLRIVRLTGSRFEGVRDIFVRRGSMEIDPRRL